MNNFIKKLNENNKLGVMLVYGENGSFIPVDILYLYVTFHTCKKYDLKNPDTIYYDDDAHFISNDDKKTIIMNIENCVKLFEKYFDIDNEFSLDNVDFDIVRRYGKVNLKKYIPYSLEDLNAYYKNGVKQMGRNYSLIPVVITKENIKDEYDYFMNEKEEKIRTKNYVDEKIVRKIMKNKSRMEKK